MEFKATHHRIKTKSAKPPHLKQIQLILRPKIIVRPTATTQLMLIATPFEPAKNFTHLLASSKISWGGRQQLLEAATRPFDDFVNLGINIKRKMNVTAGQQKRKLSTRKSVDQIHPRIDIGTRKTLTSTQIKACRLQKVSAVVGIKEIDCG